MHSLMTRFSKIFYTGMLCILSLSIISYLSSIYWLRTWVPTTEFNLVEPFDFSNFKA